MFDGPVIYEANTDLLVHSDRLPTHVMSRYRAEGAEELGVDHENVERLGVRLHAARLLPDNVDTQVKRDPERLANAVHTVARRRSRTTASTS